MMAGTQTIKVTLQRDSLQTPWGFRLQGGADFRTPFTVNKITAGSPADGSLQRGDIILDIDQRPTHSMLHSEALDLVQRAGGQISFLVQRGLNPLASFIRNQRPMSATPWSLANTPSYLDKNFPPPWSPSAAPQSPSALFRNRPLERVPAPKPLLSQTGSPLMPGPVPSVSTKTRGYVQPPSFHTERSALHDVPAVAGSFFPAHFEYPDTPRKNRTESITTTTTTYRNLYDTQGYQDSTPYVPSYQKKVHMNPNAHQPHQRPLQQYRPASTQPLNTVHRQFNSPMSLYSHDNVQDAMKSHVSHISRVSRIVHDGYLTKF
ncbi:unnamed protein product [Adineta ricciae]|uniref:PDZ domain-containing protein n=1 Tax=Adineta ricciae TaxID=249248 RepID=A0A814N3I8_ADIRI|nr:unnamed protein product [Adineta ricciae]